MSEIRKGSLDVVRELRQPLLEVRFERGKTGFRPLESSKRQVRGGDARLAQGCGLFAQLLDRLRMHLPDLRPLVLDRALELADTLQRILLEPALDRAPVVQFRFDLLDRVSVPLIGVGPAIEDVGTPLGEHRQTLLHRLQQVLRLSPLTKRKAELIDLRL